MVQAEERMARGRRSGRVKPPGPVRSCAGCRQKLPRARLLRLVARDGKAVPDPRAALPGRGAWLCRIEACARAALKQRGISRALKGKGREPSLEELLGWLDLQGLQTAEARSP
jgi:uncharacterized protein